MRPLLPRRRAVTESRSDRSERIYLPGGMPALRVAVEELLRGSWKEYLRVRTRDLAVTFERCFRSSGQPDLAVIAHSMTLLLELGPGERATLGSELPEKLHELLGRLEAVLAPDEERMTG